MEEVRVTSKMNDVALWPSAGSGRLAPTSTERSASFDSAGGPITFVWGQVLGPCAPLNLNDPSRPQLKVPPVHAEDSVLIYRLHLVKDGKMSAGDEAEIVVRP